MGHIQSIIFYLKRSLPLKIGITLLILLIMVDFGIKVSKDGEDISTNNPSNLTYSSEWSNFKIYDILTDSDNSVATSEASVIFDNPLSYQPMFFAYVEATDEDPGNWQFASLGSFSGTVFITNSAAVMPNCRYRSGTDDFFCRVYGSGNNKYTFKLILFADLITGSSASLDSVDDYGIKVSKEDNDVKTANDSDLSLTSKFQNLTIASAETQVGGNQATGLATIPHNLGYVPIHLVLVYNPYMDASTANKWLYLPSIVTNPADAVLAHSYAYADDTNLYIYAATIGPLGLPPYTDFTFKYIIFNEKLSD